jgi:hypothetical protein
MMLPCLQTGDLHIQVAENSVMLGALFAGLTVYPQGVQMAATDSCRSAAGLCLSMCWTAAVSAGLMCLFCYSRPSHGNMKRCCGIQTLSSS